MKKYRKQMMIIMLFVFVLASIFLPTVSYKAIVSEAQCALMGMSAPGTRDVCFGGKETLLAVFRYPETPDFVLLVTKGVIINLAVGIALGGSFVFLKKAYAKS